MDSFVCLLAMTVSVLLLGAGGVGGNGDPSDCTTKMIACSGIAEQLSEGDKSACGKIPDCIEKLKNCDEAKQMMSALPAVQAACSSGGNPSGGNPSGGNPSGGNPSGGNPSGGSGGCMTKISNCFVTNGFNLQKPPSEEEQKVAGFCSNTQKLQVCINKNMKECADSLGQNKQVYEQMTSQVTGITEMCKSSDGTDATPKPDENPSDSATSTQFSPLLLLVLPVFMQAWFLM